MCWLPAPPYFTHPKAPRVAQIMHATSLASADSPRPSGEVLPLKVARVRKPSPRALGPEVLREVLWRWFVPLLHGLRTTWIYRRTLHGPMPDRIVFQPALPRIVGL